MNTEDQELRRWAVEIAVAAGCDIHDATRIATQIYAFVRDGIRAKEIDSKPPFNMPEGSTRNVQSPWPYGSTL